MKEYEFIIKRVVYQVELFIVEANDLIEAKYKLKQNPNTYFVEQLSNEEIEPILKEVGK